MKITEEISVVLHTALDASFFRSSLEYPFSVSMCEVQKMFCTAPNFGKICSFYMLKGAFSKMCGEKCDSTLSQN